MAQLWDEEAEEQGVLTTSKTLWAQHVRYTQASYWLWLRLTVVKTLMHSFRSFSSISSPFGTWVGLFESCRMGAGGDAICLLIRLQPTVQSTAPSYTQITSQPFNTASDKTNAYMVDICLYYTLSPKVFSKVAVRMLKIYWDMSLVLSWCSTRSTCMCQTTIITGWYGPA